MAPLILGATDKSGSRAPILGEGEHQYEALHDWGTLPASIRYGNTHGVCEDSQGHIYIHHTVHSTSESPDTMVVFDQEGKFVRSWGGQFKGGAHGLSIRKEGGEEFLYLCDFQHGIVTKRTLKGEEVFTLGYPAESPAYQGKNGTAPSYRPTNVAIAPNGDIYVGDGYGSSYINQYNQKAQFIRTFGGLGKEAGQLDYPHGLWVDTRTEPPVLVVADRSNERLQRFTLDGKHIDFILGTTKMPCHFDERKGDVVIPDLWSKVVILDNSNKVAATLGNGDYSTQQDWYKARQQARDTFIPGRFLCPHGACFDHEGNIFVVEWVEVGRVTKLRKVA
ncbi:MAG TPA: hypothetical protein VGR55_08380 [Candidatus Acidoferrum sp.]|nr:hypothetical protein [Candidatus Acidoferrum sp.]